MSCSNVQNVESPKIDGDWMCSGTNSDFGDDYLGLRFKDDTLYTIHDNGLIQEGKYSIIGDTLVVEEFGGRINKNRRIASLTKDSLSITNGFGKYYSRRLEFSKELKLDSLELIAGVCFGDCPEFRLVMAGDGLIRFVPINNCRVTAETHFVLKPSTMSQIDSLFKWSYINKLDTNKVYRAIDDWRFDIEIVYNDDQRVKVKTTQSHIPFRLKRMIYIVTNEVRRKGLI